MITTKKYDDGSRCIDLRAGRFFISALWTCEDGPHEPFFFLNWPGYKLIAVYRFQLIITWPTQVPRDHPLSILRGMEVVHLEETGTAGDGREGGRDTDGNATP